MNKLLPRIVLLFVGLAFVCMLYIGYLRLYPFKTIDFFNAPFPVSSDSQLDKNGNLIPKSVQAGQLLVYQVHSCRYTEVDSHFTRTLIGPSISTLVTNSATANPGCRTTLITNTVIPSYLKPGTYHMKIHVCFQVNSLQNICKDTRTQDFQITLPKRDKNGNIIALPEAVTSNGSMANQKVVDFQLPKLRPIEIESTTPFLPLPPATSSTPILQQVIEQPIELLKETRLNPITHLSEWRYVGERLWIVGALN